MPLPSSIRYEQRKHRVSSEGAPPKRKSWKRLPIAHVEWEKDGKVVGDDGLPVQKRKGKPKKQRRAKKKTSR